MNISRNKVIAVVVPFLLDYKMWNKISVSLVVGTTLLLAICEISANDTGNVLIRYGKLLHWILNLNLSCSTQIICMI